VSASRETVRALVREELLKRLPPQPRSHPALLVILSPAEEAAGECSEDPELPVRRPCVIEPDRPCYNSGYCKRLGY
jgi:hypothetical protein